MAQEKFPIEEVGRAVELDDGSFGRWNLKRVFHPARAGVDLVEAEGAVLLSERRGQERIEEADEMESGAPHDREESLGWGRRSKEEFRKIGETTTNKGLAKIG